MAARETKSRVSSHVTEFHDFVDLHPELQEKYRADHYALRDEETSRSSLLADLINQKSPGSQVLRKIPSVTDSQINNGIPIQCEEYLLLPYPWYKKLRCLFLLSEYPFVQGGTLRGSNAVYNERFLQLVSFPFTIHPDSDAYLLWNTLICLLLAVSLIREPYMMTFQWEFFATNSITHFSISVNVILCVDALLQFFVGCKDPVTTIVILDRVIIRRRYLRGKFWFNILTRLPYDIVLLFVETPTQKTNVTWIRLVSFVLKLMRFEKLYWFLKKLTRHFNLDTWKTQIFMNGTFLVFCVHWGACLQWLLPDLTNAHYFELNQHYNPNTWITRLDLWDKSADFQYLNAFQKALSTILSLDGGEAIPREYEEILATVCLLSISMSVVTFFISTISTMDHTNGNRYQEVTTYVQEYLRFRRIPKWLQQRVMAYFDGRYKGHFFPESYLYTTVSESLMKEIMQHNCKGILDKLSMFQDLPTEILEDFVQRLRFEVYIPGDVLLSPHRRSDCIYFIEDGYFGVMNEFGAQVEVLESGSCFGDVDMICPAIPRKTSIVAIAISKVYKLSKVEFLQCTKMFPEVHERVVAMANAKIEKDVQNLAEQMERIDQAKLWKEIALQEKRSVEQYYADIDAGKVPAYHIPGEDLQDIYYVNYKRSRKMKNVDGTESGKSSFWHFSANP